MNNDEMEKFDDWCYPNRNNQPSDLSLQLFLANELPEMIATKPYFLWRDVNISCTHWARITPREWDWIVWQCDKKLTNGQRLRYNIALWRELGGTGAWELPDGVMLTQMLLAPWQTRAIALAKTLGKEIPQ